MTAVTQTQTTAPRADLNDRLVAILKRAEQADPARWPQLQNFLRFLKEKTCFFVAPASSMPAHHNCFEGGLLDHSVRVVELMFEVRDGLEKAFRNDGSPYAATSGSVATDYSVVVCGLFHDLSKVGDFTDHNIPYYVKNFTAKGAPSEGKPYVKNHSELTALPSGTRSLYLTSKFLDLYPDEQQAIVGADGQYVPENRPLALNETPLLMLTHFCDFMAGIMVEKGWLSMMAHAHGAMFTRPTGY